MTRTSQADHLPPHIAVLRARLSAGRFDKYLVAAHGDAVEALRLYEWNSTISAAFQESIGQFEVLFRNSIDEQLAKYNRVKLSGRGEWFDNPAFAWPSFQRGELRKAKRRAGQPIIHGKVIAELNFGFWTSLFEPQFQTTLWSSALVRAFPHLRPRQRATIEGGVTTVRDLRNRIAHYEPIHSRTLSDDWVNLVTLTGYIDQVTAAWMWAGSRVPEVLRAR